VVCDPLINSETTPGEGHWQRGGGRVLIPFRRAIVVGSSMEPTLSDGDWLIARTARGGNAVAAADLVLVEQPDRPGFLLVKRAVRRVGSGWWVEGDNVAASDDSRTFGVVPDALVLGQVILRYGPRRRQWQRY
jgi:nickel-type superoxide dismutase maturation protease